MKNKFVLSAIFLFVCFSNVFAQKAYTGNEAFARVQTERNRADELIDSKYGPAQIKNGMRILKNTLMFLDSVPIKQLAVGYTTLWYQRSDIDRDLACGYALLNQKDSAL